MNKKEFPNKRYSGNIKQFLYETENMIDDFDENMLEKRRKILERFFEWKLKEWVRMWKM